MSTNSNSKGFKEARNNEDGRFYKMDRAKQSPHRFSVEVVPKKGHGVTGRYPKKK